MGAGSLAVGTDKCPDWFVRELASVRAGVPHIVEVEPGLYEFDGGWEAHRLVGWEGAFAIMRDEEEMDERLPWAWWFEGFWSVGYATESEARQDARDSAAQFAAAGEQDGV